MVYIRIKLKFDRSIIWHVSSSICLLIQKETRKMSFLLLKLVTFAKLHLSSVAAFEAAARKLKYLTIFYAVFSLNEVLKDFLPCVLPPQLCFLMAYREHQKGGAHTLISFTILLPTFLTFKNYSTDQNFRCHLFPLLLNLIFYLIF